MSVSSTIHSMFDVSKFEEFVPNKKYSSCSYATIHKDVAINFAVVLTPNHEGKDYLGITLVYLDGPKYELLFDYELLIAADNILNFVADYKNIKFTRGGDGHLNMFWPNSIDYLASMGFLKSNNTVLHIQVNLTLPNGSFVDPTGSHIILTPTERTKPDALRVDLFSQLGNPAVTNQPFCERFELRGTDGSFWCHKSVFAFASELFKDWLINPNKPPTQQSNTFKEGVLHINSTKEALRQILHFIYLDETAPDLNKHELEMLPVAHTLGLNEVKRICERSLLGRLQSMTSVSLFQCLKDTEKFGLGQLKSQLVLKLIERLSVEELLIVDDQEVFLLNLIDYCHKKGHQRLKCVSGTKLSQILLFDVGQAKFIQMISIARTHGLRDLEKWCGKWIARNFEMFKAEGHLHGLMTDHSDNGHGVLEFLMNILCKSVSENV